jgi:hypothetical protein
VRCRLALMHSVAHMLSVALHSCTELYTCEVLPCTHAQSCTHVECRLALMHRVTHTFIIIEDGEVGQQLCAGSFCIRVNVFTAVFYVLWFVYQMVRFKQAGLMVLNVLV